MCVVGWAAVAGGLVRVVVGEGVEMVGVVGWTADAGERERVLGNMG